MRISAIMMSLSAIPTSLLAYADALNASNTKTL